jgi:hypothetical protein
MDKKASSHRFWATSASGSPCLSSPFLDYNLVLDKKAFPRHFWATSASGSHCLSYHFKAMILVLVNLMSLSTTLRLYMWFWLAQAFPRHF